MIREDYHVHTNFSDGKSTPEEVVDNAIRLGMRTIGFSDHSFDPIDTYVGIPKEQYESYRKTIKELSKTHAKEISIVLGIEQDIFTDMPASDFDYVIGSVHYIECDGNYYAVDDTQERILDAAKKHYGGDVLAVAERYYELVSQVVERTNCDIIGHFDLVSKLNERSQLFDEQSDRYISAWKKAADTLLATGRPFEINTGAISRGYKSQPYPALTIQQYLIEQGARFILSSDSHHKDTLCYEFTKWEDKLQEIGGKLISFAEIRK